MVWNPGQKLFGGRCHFDQVLSVAFSPDGGWLAAGDSSGNIKIWRRC